MELIKLLNRIKRNYKEVEEIELRDVTGNPKSSCYNPRMACKLEMRDEDGRLMSYEYIYINLHFKTEQVVERGDHQGYNDNDEPIVIEYVLKPLVVIANELVAKIEATIKTKEEIVSIASQKEELSKAEKLIKEKALKDAATRLKTLDEDEELMPELKLIESGEED